MKKKIFSKIATLLLVFPITISYAKPNTVSCSDLTGVWQGNVQDLTYSKKERYPVTIALFQKNGKVIGRIIKMQTIGVLEGVSGQIWATCKNGTIENFRLPLQKIDLNNMPKDSNTIQAPPGHNGAIFDKSHLLLYIRNCNAMGLSERARALLMKVSNTYPYKVPTKKSSYIFPDYSVNFKADPDGCNNRI